MNKTCLAIVAACLMVTMPAVAADMYKWVDKNGVFHVSDKPAPDGESAEVIRNATPDAPPDQRNADIEQERYRLTQSLSYHTGNCLQKRSEWTCNKGAEDDRKGLKLLNSDPDTYFKNK